MCSLSPAVPSSLSRREVYSIAIPRNRDVWLASKVCADNVREVKERAAAISSAHATQKRERGTRCAMPKTDAMVDL